MNWGYRFSAEAAGQLRNLGPAAAVLIKDFLEKRIKGTTNPEQFGHPLRGSRHGLWRYRVRNFRILCRLEKKILIVVVVSVGHRSTIYDD